MSNEQKQDLPAKYPDLPRQAERDSQRAEIVHPDGTREEVEIRQERMWSGALPRPEDFGKYGQIVSDAPERILRMAELEQQHRINLESQIVPADISAGKRGQWLGALISIGALSLAVIASVLGASWQVSVALVGVPVLSVARTLVAAWRSKE
jgi:uncharacterized membrane protein